MREVRIERLGRQGDGIAAGPLYAARTLPGELVRGTLRGEVLEDPKIVEPSEHRVRPPCPHYRGCGGCALQHASDAFVADWKVDSVVQALRTRNLETDIRPLHTSLPQSRRRAGFAARRTKSGALVGFHGRASDAIVPVPECGLILPELQLAISTVEALARLGASRKGVLSVMTTAFDNGLDMAVTGGKPLDLELRGALAQLCVAHGVLRLTWEGEPVAMETPPVITFGAAKVSPPPGAFLQATADGEAALVRAVREITQGAARVIDLFAGCGTFSLPLAEGSEVLAVEGSKDMLAALDAGWRHASGLKALKTEARDLFRRPLLADEFRRVDAVVIDPPRAGAEAQIAELAKSGVPVIAHVSCNPATFARDAATLVAAGYALDWVQVVDQFRWSAHVELVARFSLPHMRR
jgi:23S rRNA (uracil1939-C5)-methyltransferase